MVDTERIGDSLLKICEAESRMEGRKSVVMSVRFGFMIERAFHGKVARGPTDQPTYSFRNNSRSKKLSTNLTAYGLISVIRIRRGGVGRSGLEKSHAQRIPL